jgi:group I intron endonuclease
MSQGIYKITNLINGDCYVGQSINIERRWREHINKANSKKKFLLHKAFNKYGTENFKFEILELVPNKNDLTIKEQFYYDLYKPHYCLVEPEENPSCFNKKVVHKIDMETLEILETYESIAQASAIHNIDSGDMSNVCNRKQVSSGGFYWCFKSDYNNTWKPREKDTTYEKKKVLQFDLQNNFIKEYESISYATKVTGINKANISRSCQGTRKKVNCFTWRYANEN